MEFRGNIAVRRIAAPCGWLLGPAIARAADGLSAEVGLGAGGSSGIGSLGPSVIILLLLLTGSLIAVWQLRRKLWEARNTVDQKVLERTGQLSAELRRREELEATLRASEERLSRVFNFSPALATISSLQDQRVIAANRRFCEAFGFTAAEVVGQKTTDLGIWVNPGDRAELAAHVVAHGRVVNREVLCQTRNGRQLTILMSAELIESGAEKVALVFGVDITERRQLEDRLRNLGDNLPGSYVFQYAREPDGSARFLHVSAGVRTCHGISPEAAVADVSALIGLMHPDDLPAYRSAVERSARELSDFTADVRGRNPAGGWSWIRVASRPRREADGRIVWDGVASDLTKEREAEAALAESEETMARLFMGLHDGIVVAEVASRRFVRANDAICRMTGYTREELLALRLEQFHPAEALAYVKGEFEQQASGRKQFSGAMPVLCKDGSVLLADVSATPLTLEGRACLVGVFRDITERQRAEDRLRESEATLSAIFRGIGDCIMVADAATRELLQLNPTAEATFGHSNGELAGLRIEDLHPPEDRELVINGFARQAERGGTPAEEFRFCRKDGSVFLGEITTNRLPMMGRTCLVGVMRDVTSRRQAEQAMQERLRLQERMAGLTSAMPGVLYSFSVRRDGSWVVPEMGPRALDLLGIPAEDIMNDVRALVSRVHPGDLNRLRESIMAIIEPAAPWNCTFRFRHPQRGTIWIEGHSSAPGLRSGEPVWHGVLLEVTERRRLEARRQTEHAATRALAEGGELEAAMPRLLQALCDSEEWQHGEIWLPDPATNRLVCRAWWHREDVRFARFEEETVRMQFGLGEGLPGRTWQVGVTEVFADLGDACCCRRTESAQQAGLKGGLSIPLRSRGKVNGVMVFLGSDVQPADSGQLETLAMIGAQIGQFIERRNAEAELQRFVTLSPTVIYALRFTPTGLRAYWVSDNLESLTGFRVSDSIHGGWWRENLHPDDRARVLAAQRSWESGDYQLLEFRFRHRDGRYLWLRDEKRLLRGPDGEPWEIVGAWTDVTQRHSLESQLLQAQKMEAIGQLSGGIAHDFNNILGAIIGNAQLAEMDLAPEHPASESVGQILKASHRASQLVRQILTFARQNSEERHPVDLRSVVEESVRLLRSTIPTLVDISFSAADGLEAVLADGTQIQQVILNLGTNAWHALGPSGGRIEIGLAAEQVTPEVAAGVTDLNAGAYLRLWVSDNGRGMSPEVVARIFDPFFTTKEPGKGTGLGLSVVHGIVKSHEGAIRVRTAPGAGTTFELYFPVARGDVARSEEAQAERPRGQGQHVLVVDDEESMLRATSRVLERLGYRVTPCGSAGAALPVVVSLPSDVELVLTDFNMPGMSGLEFTQTIRQAGFSGPIMLSSGFVSDELRRLAANAGVQEILRKPATVEDLSDAVNRLLTAKS